MLPAVTTATGAFLVAIVFGMADGIRHQSAALGHADEIGRAVVLIAVTVLLVGVAEVAVATTRTVAHRVLAANGVPRAPVVAALLVEPVIAAAVGALAGAILAVLTGVGLGVAGIVATGVSYSGLLVGTAIALAVSVVAALGTSVVPTWKAASRPPIRSLAGG